MIARRSRRRRTGIVLAALALGVAAAGLPQDAPVRRPLSPGAVALMLAGKIGPAELARWREALADPRAETRAAVARAARVSGATGLVPALLGAVAVEKDRAAAREELMVLGRLDPGESDEALFTAAKRFEGALDGTLARSLALRGPQALPLVPRLGGLALTEFDWSDFFAWATSEGREGLPEAAAQAVALANPTPWAVVLSMARRTGAVIDEAVMARALGSDSAGVRERTYWHLVASAGGGSKKLEPVLAAAPEARSAPGVDPLALLALELLGRTLGRPETDRTALIQGLSAADRRRLPGDARALAALRGPEKAAYGVARFDDPGAVEATLKAVKKLASVVPVARERRVRTASDLTPGLAADVMALTGCSPSDEPRWAALEVRHDEKGAVAALGLSRSEDLGACEPAARALLLMASAPTDRPFRPRETDHLALPLLAEFTACLAEPEPSSPPAGGGPGHDTLVPGQKTKSTPARYPPAAARERRQGTVVVQIGASPSGCVRSAEVLAGDHVDLEAEALRTVVRWRYTPTLLDGRPVPTVMTVAVNFRLN